MIKIITDRNESILRNKKLIELQNNNKISTNIHIFVSIEKLLTLIDKKYHSTILTFHNKHNFHNFMVNNNLSYYIPKRYSAPLAFPCIIKKHIGLAGRGTFVFSNMNEWTNVEKDINLNEYITQEYIKSEYSYICHIVAKHGQILLSKVYQEKNPYELFFKKGCISSKVSRIPTKEETKLFSHIMKISKYHGVCCIDYGSINNTIKIYEINPRFGGSLVNNTQDFLQFLRCIISNKVIY